MRPAVAACCVASGYALSLGGMALMQQRQINYTRSNESEADRLGIQTLARSDYAPEAMADFFVKLQAVVRSNQGGELERTPD